MPICLCLTGPTACGKTELALELARALPVEIVSMDSALVYRGMDIGTAKPSAAVRADVPHHLIDVVEPTVAYSAGRFAADAGAAVAEISARGKIPLLVGGTLLYLRAFRDGLARLPGADPELRRRIDEEAERIGWPALHRRLAALDPAAAARIAPADRQRIQRALEVYALTGEPISSQQRGPKAQAAAVDVRTLAVVDEDRRALGIRIEQRFDAMIDAGFVAEVEALRARGDLRPEMPSMRAVGYRQLWSHLSGELAWQEARRQAITATRRLAKRQMTWLRADANLQVLGRSNSGLARAALDWARSAVAT